MAERAARPIELPRPPERASERADPARPGAPAELRYERTRTVPVSSGHLRAQRISGGFERSPLAGAFKRLRAQVLNAMRHAGANTLAVTSPRDGEGKTLTAINLAVHVSMEIDWTVLLVDADLRRPGVHRALGMPEGPGLSDYLLGQAAIEDVLVHPGFGRFVILPAGASVVNSAELLGSARMLSLVAELRARYPGRLVIFDLPPLLACADALSFVSQIEYALLVVEDGGTPRDDVVRAAQLLDGTRLIGTVLNKARESGGSDRDGEEDARPRRASWWRRLLRD